MLTDADDMLFHQLPLTFDHVGTSDPRFYDRYWFAAHDPRRRLAVHFTLGVYSNMNVMDAAVAVVHEGQQFNVRSSRTLRPDMQPACPPLRIDVIRALHEFALVVEPGDHPVSGELRWKSLLPPEQETPHFQRHRGRVIQDYQRFNQIGEVTGCLSVAGQQLELNQCWGCRDHSWGVRPGFGVPEPQTGPKGSLQDDGFLLAFLFFSTDALAGHVHVSERAGKRTYLSGTVARTSTALDQARIENARLELDLNREACRVRTVAMNLTLADGRIIDLDVAAAGPAVVMPGLGYSGGFNDGRGLGAWRGEAVSEYDVWDVSGEQVVLDERGAESRPWHRIQPVVVDSRGDGLEGSGTGSLTVLAVGKQDRHNIESGVEVCR